MTPFARLARAAGILGVTLGAMSLLAVTCFLFPAQLTSPALREVYPMPFMRALLQSVIITSFALGVVDVFGRARVRCAGAYAIGFATVAVLLGGAEVPVNGLVAKSDYLGLDWFLLDLLVVGLVFIPLERALARRRDQGIFRPRWRTDLVYFFIDHLLLQVTTFLTIAPARVFFAWAVSSKLQVAVASQPAVLQFAQLVVTSDLTQYAVHRAAHRFAFLWRIHAVHHSVEQLDWLAGSRIHFLDLVLTRAIPFIPIFVFGFSPGAVLAYLVFLAFHATFNHTNVGVRFRGIERVMVTPRYHHWHHSSEKAAIDTNFALHLTFVDRIFGTHHLPPGDAWPATYGLDGERLPNGYFGQFLHPFRLPPRAE